MSAAGWVRFFMALLPELTELARELFQRHKGHVGQARQELTAIRDHGARLRAAENEIDARLAEVKRRVGRPDEH
jgi:hypothetical protein